MFRRTDPRGTTTSYISLTSIPIQSESTPTQCQRSNTATVVEGCRPHRSFPYWFSRTLPAVLIVCGRLFSPRLPPASVEYEQPHPRRRRVWTSSLELCTLLISTQGGIHA